MCFLFFFYPSSLPFFFSLRLGTFIFFLIFLYLFFFISISTFCFRAVSAYIRRAPGRKNFRSDLSSLSVSFIQPETCHQHFINRETWPFIRYDISNRFIFTYISSLRVFVHTHNYVRLPNGFTSVLSHVQLRSLSKVKLKLSRAIIFKFLNFIF